MANTLEVLDANGVKVSIQYSAGTGTAEDPFIVDPTSTIADGADVALGATADAAAAADDSTASLIALFKRWLAQFTWAMNGGFAISEMPQSVMQFLLADEPTDVSDTVPLPVVQTGAIPTGGNTIGGTKDAGPVWTTARGIAGVPFTSADATSEVACTSLPTNGQKLRVTDLVWSVNMDCTLTFYWEDGDEVFVFYPKAGASAQLTTRGLLNCAVADKRLTVKTSVAGAVSVTAFYYSEA